MKSPKFKTDFLNFIKNEIKRFYLQKIPKKLNSIRIFICKMTSSKIKGDISYQDSIEEYFWKNKQCKLPWSFAEIDDAIESIISRLIKANVNIDSIF